MMKTWFYLVGVLLLNELLYCDAAKILGIFIVPGKSHFLSAKPIFHALAERGHDITIVSRFPAEQPILNYKDIVLDQYTPSVVQGLFNETFFIKSPIAAPFRLMGYGLNSCRELMEMTQMKELIDSDEKYDLLFIEYFFNECTYGLYYKFKSPIILYVPNTAFELLGDAVGNPSFYSYVPDVFTTYSDHMSLSERIYNTLLCIWFNLARYLYYVPKQNELLEKYFTKYDVKPNVADVERQASLLFINSHPVLHDPRPLTPNTITLGGLHIHPSKELPQHLQSYLDQSKEGVIYFSFGSIAKCNELPENLLNAFLSAFSKIKSNVLWKCEVNELPGLPKNVKLEKWLPQQDVLGHPNMRMFITHGGLHGIEEAVYNGVPIIGIFLFGDQPYNVARAERLGYGIPLALSNVTSDSVEWAINTILTNPSYKQRANEISQLFKDQPISPLEKAIFWTEHVLRHKGAKHLRSGAVDLYWFQRYLVDVIIICLIAIIVIFYILIKAIQLLLFFTRKRQIKMKKQ